MVVSPLSADLQKAYRDTLLVAAAPSFIDSDEKILPVAIIANATSTAVAQFFKLTDGTDTVAVNANGSIATEKHTKHYSAITTNTTTALVATACNVSQIILTQAAAGTDGGVFEFKDNATTFLKVNVSGSAASSFGNQLVNIPFPKDLAIATSLNVTSTSIAGTVGITVISDV